VASVEPGESWAWCYAHNRFQQLGEYQLWSTAAAVGIQLFGGRLKFPSAEEVRIRRSRLSELRSVDRESPEAHLGTYEYVFFPFTGGGLGDVSGRGWRAARRGWSDSDNRIYTARSDGTVRVVEVDVQLE